MAAFIVQIGTRTIESDAQAIDIGTRSSCALPIRDSIASSRHAWIRRRDGTFVLEDAGSSTGTWRNGELVTGPVPLADGDVIVVGTARIDVKVEPSTLRLAVAEQAFFFETSRQHKIVVGKKADGTDDVRTVVGDSRVKGKIHGKQYNESKNWKQSAIQRRNRAIFHV